MELIKPTSRIINNQKKWYALYVRSRSEKKVAIKLTESGITNYLPLIKTMRTWSDRKKMVEVPLFNGYVFVHSQENEYDKILRVNNVVGFVKLEGKKAIVKENEINRLKQLVNLGYNLEAGQDNYHLEKGDLVKINEGPLKGLEGSILENNLGKYIFVRIESLSQVIRVKLPEELLIPIN